MSEKIKYENDLGRELVGIYTGREHEKVVILCHGLFSDKDSNTLFSTIAKSLDKKDIGTFRFDFSGCGESNNAPLSMYQMRKDLAKTVEIINGNDDKDVFILGHSLGGQIALSQNHKLILLAPYLNKDPERISYLKKKLDGKNSATVENKFGKSFKITPSFVEEMSAITLKESLSKINNETTFFEAKKDKLIPKNIYQEIKISENKFINVIPLKTNHFFTTKRKKLFKEISLFVN